MYSFAYLMKKKKFALFNFQLLVLYYSLSFVFHIFQVCVTKRTHYIIVTQRCVGRLSFLINPTLRSTYWILMCSKVQNPIIVQRAKAPHCGFTDTEKWISNHRPTWNSMHPIRQKLKLYYQLIDYHGIEDNYF